jgi:hypothetical protein
VVGSARIAYGAWSIQQGWAQIEAGGVLDTIPVVGWAVAIPFEVIGTFRVVSGWSNLWGGAIQSFDGSQTSPPPDYNPPVPITLDHQFSPEWLKANPWYQPVINVTPAVGPVI